MPDPPIDSNPPTRANWQPNRIVRVLIRVARTYVQATIGFLGLTAVGNVVPGAPIPLPYEGLQAVGLAFYAGLFPALIALLQNAYEELSLLSDPGSNLRG